MYTQCPQCMTYFQVTAEHLKIAQGNVRCGHCRNVFSALGNLTEHLPETPSAATTRADGQFDSSSTEVSENDFLTDEELSEFQDFDTNLYDDEDSIFDAFIDDTDDEETVEAAEPSENITLPAQDSKPDIAPTAQQSRRPAQVKTEATPAPPQTPPDKRLASLAEGQKVYLEKLQQANLAAKQINSGATRQPAAPSAATTSVVLPKVTPPITQANNPTSQEKFSTPRASTTTAAASHAIANATAQAIATKPNTKTDNSATRPDAALETQQAQKHKPDIPVQAGNEDVDFDSALQALDELEINDEHADFVASVIKEFEATNIVTPAQEQPATPAQAFTPDSTEKTSISPPSATPEKTKTKKTKPKKEKKKRTTKTVKADTAPSNQSINEAAIPTLPAILREGYQEEEAVHHRMTPASMAWSVGSMLLMLFFLGQTVYFKHDQLAHNSTLRPWIESFCQQFNCEISLQYDASELELLGQDIRSHPKVKGALMVSTTILNKADYRQAYPGLQITFTDMNGQRVAMRRFLPEEYLPTGTNIKRGMPQDTPIQVELELMDPGNNAINFEFEFFKSI